MARTFAQATGQESHVYYSEDYMKKGNEKIFLKSKAALAAWNVRVKDAKDLGGRVRYVPGMPIFIAGGNIATELGISNGSIGVLVSLEYKLDEKGRRYATSAVVDMPKYVNPDASESHPHRVTLTPVSTSIQFRLDGSEQLYSATRRQLPIIPAFAFTAHNSQGRSLHVCCIDLAGCTTTEAAYVMLSRVRSLEGLCILRPFSFSKISTRISEQLRTELKRGIELGENTFAEAKHTLHWFYDIFPDGDIANVASQMMGGDSMVVD
ncbi:hypothetical protein DL96DRAFT_1475472 [Flagelloscypha sp. PMI_526]|nr:hypothetical protein DL96DRAFT_1475472 [Flagelloscypha sp. PMI_526]